jgi:ketosteroid isomerase-like protein
MESSEESYLAALRRAFEAFNRGDYDAALEIAHPEIEFTRPGGLAPVAGIESMRQWMEPDAFEELRLTPLEFRLNGRRVLVRQRMQARGAASGIQLDMEAWSVWTFDDAGRATRIQGYLERERTEAMAAAGLAE